MTENRAISAAFLISFSAHCLVFGVPGIIPGASRQVNKPLEKEDIKISLDIERPALLPKIETMGPRKKFKEVKVEPEQPRPEVKPSLAEQAVLRQLLRKPAEERVDVASPEKEAMLRYQDIVKQRIEQARLYPLWAKKQGVEGVARVYFTVLPDGRLRDARITGSSGAGVLDGEALATVRRAGPFPPAPREISGSAVSMEVAIVFSLDKNRR